MRRATAALFVMALILGVVPAAGAISDAGPGAVSWVETDDMGGWVMLAAKDKCIKESWIQSHLTFFRGGTGDTLPENPFDNAGQFTAVENGTTMHSGDIWWVVSGRTRLEPVNEFVDPCNPQFGFPVQGEFHGKGMLRINESDEIDESELVDREGTVCGLSFTTHLTGDVSTMSLEWTGNFVAHCDDGARIHATVTGPTGGGSEPGGITQIATGVIHDK